ncbi:MAG: hypothetical protein KF723_05260 [Rhizobiaceae bacterium]|nr:hypothetical protein [Rhizobiaceae bacterium]
MGKINREWHAANVMPKNAGEDERIAWHVAHAQHCGCRKIEGGVAAMFARHGVPIPKPRPDAEPRRARRVS